MDMETLYYEALGYLNLNVKEKDVYKANQLLEKLAADGYADAFYHLGRAYAIGEGYTMDVVKAKELYESGMSLGSLKCFYGYALLHTTGHGVLKDERTAKDYFEAGYLGLLDEANQNDPVSLYIMGSYYYHGFYVKKYVATAIEYLEKSAKIGFSEAQFLLGSIYEALKSDVGRIDVIFDNYSKAAIQGHAYAQYALALLYIDGEVVDKNYFEAKKWLELSALQHHYLALHTLGLFHYEGEFGKKDFDKAFVYLKESADLGYASSQYYVGLMNKNGDGVEKNPDEAVVYLTLAANQGDMNAQYHLGVTYFKFKGMTHYDKAFFWLNKAAEQKHPYAQYNLGVMYQNGDFVNQDYQKASVLYRQAAEKDVLGALYNLGILYVRGLGVEKSEKTAMHYWKKAADLGHEPSKTYLEATIKFLKRKE
ncbi:TPR repeat protein [Acholeplasma morum]|uniref:tetratricopeptide repeat protein n=1 Tax=Paracholeplasma morum TaxID=264637 RepID=UPI00195BCE92|nr:tetratricopeptide repeat protein [Paracholeplasma morum]MBM7452802.1 TPR repeat protein [Paracholeplasma morum]